MSVRQIPPYIDPTERGSYDTDELDALEARQSTSLRRRRAHRYVVRTVTGYKITHAMTTGGNARVGLSAHVCDSLCLYCVVATYRSDDRINNNPARTVGRDGAVLAAVEHAARLNG